MTTINPALCDFIQKHFTTPVKGTTYIPRDYTLPIRTLDGISVNVEISTYTIDKNTLYSIQVEHRNFMDCEEQGNRRLFTESSFKSIADALTFLADVFLPTFKIDIMRGRFICHNNIENDEAALLVEFSAAFENNERVGGSIQKCCVCYDMTRTRTDCNHTLCLRCADKIHFKCDDDECGFDCPLCRTSSNSISIY